MRFVLCHYNFNQNANGGEVLSLSTILQEDGQINQEITLNSYSNSATFNIGFELTPEKLREAADALEHALSLHQRGKLP